jgi:hypothetical protein
MVRRALVVALPGVALAIGGLNHPTFLNPETAHQWWVLHVWALPLFPLLAAALCWLVRGDTSCAARIARVAGYGFAVGYTALDAVDGIGAGLVVDTRPDGQGPVVLRLFEIGDRIGHVGIWMLVVCVFAVTAALWRGRGLRLLPGVVVFLIGTRLFWEYHIFHPRGVAAMLLLAAGSALLALPDGVRARSR